uniref:Uncharacterized protein n=1 Tax=Meloidogyne enterolobii TaxID=390850 RepID=A0A6V7X8B0_MELEN|nr:unnamed protein product [Meloidogyne enterolobii]
MCSIGGKIFITSVFLVIIFEFEVVSCPRPGSGRVQPNANDALQNALQSFNNRLITYGQEGNIRELHNLVEEARSVGQEYREAPGITLAELAQVRQFERQCGRVIFGLEQPAQLASDYESLINLINQALQRPITRQIRRDLIEKAQELQHNQQSLSQFIGTIELLNANAALQQRIEKAQEFQHEQQSLSQFIESIELLNANAALQQHVAQIQASIDNTLRICKRSHLATGISEAWKKNF